MTKFRKKIVPQIWYFLWLAQMALTPAPLRVAKTGKINLNEEITPSSPHWDRQEI